jgi:hypothetical protein
VLVGLIATAPAHASTSQYRVFQDDRLLIYSGPVVRNAILDNAKQFGVDVIRVQFVWRNIALSKPSNPSDPNAYGNAWSNWDSLVIEARKRGMRVLATVTGPAPSWAAGTTDKYFTGSRYPSAKAFGEFMTAVGRRYSGTAKASGSSQRTGVFSSAHSAGFLDPPPGGAGVLDPPPCTPVPPVVTCAPDGQPVLPPPPGGGGGGGGGGEQPPPPDSGGGDQSAPPPPGSGEPTPPVAPGTPLPKISIWSIYNEPNHPLFLSPQRRKGVLVAPSLYRGLYRAGWGALQKTGHRRDTILIGETLPIGSNGSRETSTTSPLTFARELFCMNGTGKRHPGCSRYRKLHASGWALHPYYRRTGPYSRPPEKDDLTPMSVGRLQKLLVRAGRKGRVNRGLSMWDTENGSQTRPPDPKGTTLQRQARFINEAEYLAWRNPRMRSFSQYLLVDEQPVWAFQSGLRFQDGKPKPALQAYQLPIHVGHGKGRTTIWGRIPPGGNRVVTIHPSSGKDVQVRVRGRGYFTKRVAKARTYQLRYGDVTSRTAR